MWIPGKIGGKMPSSGFFVKSILMRKMKKQEKLLSGKILSVTVTSFAAQGEVILTKII